MNSVDVVENVQKERWSIDMNQRYYFFGASEATRLRQGYGAVSRPKDYFGARELTIFSKRESARSASHCGLNFSSP
jgi:hypothetical protein